MPFYLFSPMKCDNNGKKSGNKGRREVYVGDFFQDK